MRPVATWSQAYTPDLFQKQVLRSLAPRTFHAGMIITSAKSKDDCPYSVLQYGSQLADFYFFNRAKKSGYPNVPPDILTPNLC